ncbi:MAG: CocE/NonD family hydrolase [Candidatus Aminicenantes bacterium RBG_16_66_30]
MKTMPRPPFRAVLVVILGVLFGDSAVAQDRGDQDLARRQLEYTRANYTKYDYRIPMRDGVKLFTTVYVPKDKSQAYPIMMQRTPYSVGPYGIDNYRAVLGPSELFEKEGFIFVYQDVRGRYLSEGEFVDVPFRKVPLSGPADTDESTDTYDTVDWLVRHVPGNNGRVGIWGISYGGFFAAFALIDAHPALKAVSPQAPMGDVGNGDDAFHNGAFYLAANFGFYTFFRPRPGGPELPGGFARFDFGTPDAYDFFLRMGSLAASNEKYFKNGNPYWDYNLDHASYDDFWQVRSLVPHMKAVKPAVLFVGGWFDAEDLAGPLKLFQSLEKNGPLAPNTLVMGPWPHGGWARMDGDRLGNLSFGSKTGPFYREMIEFPFFLYHLKGRGDGLKGSKDGAVPKAWLFATGTNEWRRFEAWPPREAREKTLYLGPGGKLTFEPSAESGEAFDEYVSDPAKPVPVIGRIGEGMPGDYMTEDQRFASRRPDVLVYETEPLDRDVVIAGPVRPALRVSTSGTDSDFDVKLIDVYPNDYPDPVPNPGLAPMAGYQQLVRGEPFRGKYRKGLDKPVPFEPGKVETIDFSMPDVYHTFRAGHRIMVQIQSSWFPLTDRNPQKFVDIPKAKASDFEKAVERVYRGGLQGSRIRVPVLE